MNQIDTGKFIASCRKEKGLTQAQLAEKLNITDRAVSKWETGKCMPDSSIMLELCNILDVTVNELLSGERIEMNNYEEKVNENLIELNSCSNYWWLRFSYHFRNRSCSNICGILCFYNRLASVFFFQSFMEQLVFQFPCGGQYLGS